MSGISVALKLGSVFLKSSFVKFQTMRYPSHKVRIQTQGTMSTAYNQLALLMAPYSEKTSPQMLAVLDNCLTQPPTHKIFPNSIYFSPNYEGLRGVIRSP